MIDDMAKMNPSAYAKASRAANYSPPAYLRKATVPIQAAQSQATGSTQLGCPDFAKIKTTTV
jgi:hypothetical protein